MDKMQTLYSYNSETIKKEKIDIHEFFNNYGCECNMKKCTAFHNASQVVVERNMGN